MTPPKLRNEPRSCPKEETKLYREIERLCGKLRKGKEVKRLSNEARLFLLHPIRTYSRYEDNLVWRLICQMQKQLSHVVRFYAVDKNLFFEAYQTWSPSMQQWVVEYIDKSYDSKLTYD